MLEKSNTSVNTLADIPIIDQSTRLGDVFASIGGMLRRRWLLITAVTVFISILAFVGIAMMTPKYDAIARIRIDPSRNPMSQDQSQSVLNSEAIETEVSVMTSQELARLVVNRLRLEHDPEFSTPVDREHILNGNEQLNQVARKVMRNVSVGRDQLSYVIALGFRSRDAQKAARIANGYAEAYLDLRVKSQTGTSSRQADFFRDRLKKLGDAVNAADSRLAEYRARAGISENSTTGTITDQQIAPLSTQLATAESDAAEANSKAAVARAQIASGNLDAVDEVQASKVITDMRRQRAEIVRNMGEVQARYGARHPEFVRVNDQLEAIDKQIRDEANRVVVSLQGNSLAANARVGSLRTTMRALQGERASNTRASALAERLEHEAQSARAAYDTMSKMSLESTQGVSNSIAGAEIIDRAQPPSVPASPKRTLLGGLTVLIALSLALGTAILLEMSQGGFLTVDEVQSRYGLKVLAAIPHNGMYRGLLRRSPVSPADNIGAPGATSYSEAVRNLRSSLFGINKGQINKVVAFTSAVPEEGKTTTSLSLARMLAINGARTLLIDCDLRNSGLRALITSYANLGLIDVLSGKATLASAVAPDAMRGLDLLMITETIFTSQDIFGDGQMAKLLDQARANYDRIILDLPPVLGVADSRTLAVLADAVGFVVRWGKTSPKAVDLAISSLKADGVLLAGFVLTLVDPRSEAAGGIYYSRAYGKYYSKV